MKPWRQMVGITRITLAQKLKANIWYHYDLSSGLINQKEQ